MVASRGLGLRFPGTEGQRPVDFERGLEFGKALNQLAARDAAVHKLTAEVQHLLRPRSVLREPELVERVKALAAQTRPVGAVPA